MTGTAFAAGSERLVTASADTTLRTWSTSSGLVESVLRGHSSAVYDLAVHPDGALVASSSADGTVRLWDVLSGRELARIGTPKLPGPGTIATAVVNRLDFQPSGELLAIAGSEGELELWDVERRRSARTLSGGEEGFAIAVRWSVDGERLLVLRTLLAPVGSTLELVDAQSGDRVAHRELERMADIAFSPDGSSLAAAIGQTVVLLDAHTLADVRELVGHEARVDTLTFSPDGRRLASSASNDPVRIWDLASGETLLSLSTPGVDINELAFDPDGAELAAACSDWSAIVWSTAPAVERESASRQELARRRALLAPLDALFEASADPEVVLERLQADPQLDPERLVTAEGLARLAAPDTRSAEREAWRVLRLPHEGELDVHLALWSAQVAARLEPADERVQLLLGAARYRLGQLDQALEALERADALRGSRGRVEVLAFLAMTRHRLGDAAGAREAHAELSALMQIPVLLVQRENQALLLESEAVLRSAP